MSEITASVVSQPISATVSGSGGITASVGSSAISVSVAGGIGPQGPAGSSAAVDDRWNLFLPPPPFTVTAVAGVAQATVFWSVPDNRLSLSPIDYRVQYKAGAGDWVTFSRNQSENRVAVVTGLTNGVSHRFRVATVSQIGVGDYSDQSNAVIPAVAPTPEKILLHFDGVGNSFTDSSATPRTIQAFGDVTQSSAASKFGGKSGLFSGGYLTTTGIEFGASDFSAEAFIKTTSSRQYATIVSVPNGYFDPGAWTILLNATQFGSVSVYAADYSTSNPLLHFATAGVCDGAWHHIAFVRNGTTASLYIDGTRQDSKTFPNPFSITGSPISVGTDTVFNTREFIGNIDELRIVSLSNGGYTGTSITVPAAAFV